MLLLRELLLQPHTFFPRATSVGFSLSTLTAGVELSFPLVKFNPCFPLFCFPMLTRENALPSAFTHRMVRQLRRPIELPIVRPVVPEFEVARGCPNTRLLIQRLLALWAETRLSIQRPPSRKRQNRRSSGHRRVVLSIQRPLLKRPCCMDVCMLYGCLSVCMYE